MGMKVAAVVLFGGEGRGALRSVRRMGGVVRYADENPDHHSDLGTGRAIAASLTTTVDKPAAPDSGDAAAASTATPDREPEEDDKGHLPKKLSATCVRRHLHSRSPYTAAFADEEKEGGEVKAATVYEVRGAKMDANTYKIRKLIKKYAKSKKSKKGAWSSANLQKMHKRMGSGTRLINRCTELTKAVMSNLGLTMFRRLKSQTQSLGGRIVSSGFFCPPEVHEDLVKLLKKLKKKHHRGYVGAKQRYNIVTSMEVLASLMDPNWFCARTEVSKGQCVHVSLLCSRWNPVIIRYSTGSKMLGVSFWAMSTVEGRLNMNVSRVRADRR